jgi:hypothetical protein
MGREQADAMLEACAQIEAASKLMYNADTVVKDMTNLGTRGVFQQRKSQSELPRVSPKHQLSLEAMVRELSHTLFGKPLLPDGLDPEEAAVWAAAAGFFGKRIQEPGDNSEECTSIGRQADMGLKACRQLKSKVGRLEAYCKLISNRDRVIQDMCNPGSKTIESGKDVTQADLARVDGANRGAAVEMVRALQSILLDQSAPVPSTLEDAAVWHQAATFLAARLQDEDSGLGFRAPDVSSNGAAAMRQALGAIEACCKLMLNHEMVAQDITNSSGGGVLGGGQSQPELKRLNPCTYPTVTAMLKEACGRLLGNAGSSASTSAEALVWGDAAEFFSKRIQGAVSECPGRAPDMSAGAATALRNVLKSIAFRDTDAYKLEAARSLMANRDRVCRDITNGTAENIDGKALSQTDLKRVVGERATVDKMYSAVCARLAGKPPLSKPSTLTEVRVWSEAAAFLAKRVQGTKEQMESRKPDMSAGAAQALGEVLNQIVTDGNNTFAAAADAAKKLQGNEKRVVDDICNGAGKNIDGKALTQTNLERVGSSDRNEVSKMYREVINVLSGNPLSTASANIAVWGKAARYLSSRTQGTADEMRGRPADMSSAAAAALRMALAQISQVEQAAAASNEAANALSGNKDDVVKDIANSTNKAIKGGGVSQPELERVDAKNSTIANAMVGELINRLKGQPPKAAAGEQAAVWAVAARYLAGRVQGTQEAMPGRKPDMSAGAAAAMCAALAKIGEESDAAATKYGGSEAADLLSRNQAKVVEDICNSQPISQPGLLRVEEKNKQAISAMIGEVCKMLRGQPAAKVTAQQAASWVTAAEYLSGRVQGSPAACPGRSADMSSYAAKALQDVLARCAADAAFACSVSGASDAAAALKGNKDNVAHDIAKRGWNRPVVDAMLAEVINRLEGKASNSNPSTEDMVVWAAAALFLSTRLQGSPAECPGRRPDMQSGAAKALRSVLAKMEAGCKLQANQARVVADITNSSAANIEGKLLTQTTLTRVDNKQSVDSMIKAVCDCLQGKPLKKAAGADAAVWSAAATFLSKRVQGEVSDCPGRQPDMSAGAAAALRAVLSEIGDGVARTEAAIALKNNQKRVVADIVNTDSKNIDKTGAVTQTQLVRVDPKSQAEVDAMITQVIARLEGKVEAAAVKKSAVSAQAASFLSKRVQGSSGDMPGRKADMSYAAAAALRTVLAEFS